VVYDPRKGGLSQEQYRELQEIRNEFERNQKGFIEFTVHNVAPAKPKQGQAYYADGTNWNPGSGKGLYSYDGSGWVFLENTATYSTATTTAEGIIELATSSEAQAGTDTSKAITPATLRDFLIPTGEVATTSGTSVSITGIPSWAKIILVVVNSVSTNGTSRVLLQLGDSGGVENTGYVSYGSTNGGNFSSTAGFALPGVIAADERSGIYILVNISGNTWIASGDMTRGTTNSATLSGNKTLSGTLTQINLTTAGGTDTFDNGEYEAFYG
jgi:hypothetical protein